MIRIKYMIIAVLVLMGSFAARADTEIKGTVKDPEGKPLSSVMVRVEAEKAGRQFATTDRYGKYCLVIDEKNFGKNDPISMSFSKLGYETTKKFIEYKTQTVDIELHKTSTKLREVVVKAPAVRLRSDTVAFDLASFAGKDDLKLKDALKKVPGVDVAESGEIKYNGKRISNFYIEGMDLLGGRYNIATEGLPASYVSAVEILNNHQEVKIDRKIFNDNVAINIRLKPKAKFRPTGSYDLKAGYGRRFLGELSGAGMLFRKETQAMVTLKGSDIEEFSERSLARFYTYGEGASLSDNADRLLGAPGASVPPLSRSRWLRPLDISPSVNFITLTSKDATLRANAEYSYLKGDYGYSSIRSYFDGSSDVILTQDVTASEKRHRPAFSLEYRVNSDKVYLVEEFRGKAAITDRSVPVSTGSEEIRQRRDLDNYDLANYLNIGWKRGRWRWNATSRLEFMSTPGAETSISYSTDAEDGVRQTAKAAALSASANFSGGIDVGRSRISLPLGLSYRHEMIRSSLRRPEETGEAFNRLEGSTFRLSLTPSYYYSSDYSRFVLNIGIPVRLEFLDFDNRGSVAASTRGSHWLISPNLSVNYTLSSRSRFKLNASYSESTGDILDFLTAPVMRDYMSVSRRSGILSKTDVFSSGLRYDLSLPVSMWFANVGVNYSLTKSNLLPGQNVSDDIISSSSILSPNHSDAFSVSAGVSKNFLDARTKISLDASWIHSRNNIMQNENRIRYFGDVLTLTPKLTSNPWKWIEFTYEASFSTQRSRYLDRRQSFSMQSHDIMLKFFPFDGFSVSASSEITRREIAESRFKTMALFDMGAGYTWRSFRFGIELRNLLDCRSYSYTVFSSLDRFSYSYRLRGRELLLTLTFTR